MGERVHVSVDEALSIVRDIAPRARPERVAAAASLGRVTAEPVRARREVPAFRAAAMDGYAVCLADAVSGRPIPIAGSIAAGCSPPALRPASALAISTGAPLPDDADCIVPRECVSVAGGLVTISPSWSRNANIRAVGEDMPKGGVVVARGTVIGPDTIGAMVASGNDTIDVYRRPRMAVLSTGSELARGDHPARIPDSNAPMIAACLIDLGIDPVMLGVARDEEPQLASLLDDVHGDVIVSTGGVSAGNHDLVRAALEARGARILLHGIAMRPGKPILVALLPDGRPYFGLPGNPIAALVGCRFFVTALLRATLGLPPEQGAPIEVDVAARGDVTLFLRGVRTMRANGGVEIDATLDQRAHVLSSVVDADCWLRVDRAGALLFEKAGRLR